MSVNASNPTATLIGDIVGSKQAANRAGLQATIERVLRAVNDELEPAQRLAPTVGDEFQGAFDEVSQAVLASLILRLELLVKGGVDSRYGLGFGVIETFETAGASAPQDGPGWWSARAAIDRARERARSARTSFSRTCFETSKKGSQGTEWGSAVDAMLLLRDATVGAMNSRGHRLLLGTLRGASQAELAREEGVTQPAVSQALAASGAYALIAAQKALEAGRP